MAYPKSVDYHDEEIALARFAKALGHPARVAIMKHLASMPDCCFTDLLNELPIAQSTVSQHLKELKDSALIQGNVEPPRVRYCIDPVNWKRAQELFRNFLGDLSTSSENQDCC